MRHTPGDVSESMICLTRANGKWAWLDAYARGLLAGEAADMTAESFPACRAALRERADSLGDPSAQRYDLEFDLVCGSPRPTQLVETLLNWTDALPDARRLSVNLHCAAGETWWQWALAFFGELERRRDGASNQPLVRRAYGTFTMPPEDVGEALIRLGVKLHYVWADRFLGCEREPDEQEAVIEEMAGFGFRLPVHWYVHPQNIDLIRARSDDVLEWNRQSGVSLAPIQEHPCFGARLDVPPVPAPEFARLTADLYHRHPYFDETFEPVARVIDRLDRAAEVGRPLRFLIDEKGRVVRFLKLPLLGRAVATVETPAAEVARLAGQLGRVETGRFTDSSARCVDCAWRQVCRGVDAPTGGRDRTGEELGSWACASWLFWAQAMIWERVAVSESRDQEVPTVM